MLKNYHPYLRDIGLSEIQIQLYDYIIEEKTGTILEIKEKLIKEQIIQGEIGRPKRVYSIVE